MKIGIIGGGIGGSAAAYALLLKGHAVTIFEQAPAFGEVGAGVQMTPNVVKAIKGLGLYDTFMESGFFPKAIVGRNWQTAQENFRIDLGEEFQAHYDAPYVHIHRADLLDLFASRMPPECCRFKAKCTGVELIENGARATFEDGSSFEADLIVG
ncbi:MAG: FAD-dependent oxidoreductase, partial [Sulfitobacter sp. SK025]